VLSPKVLPQSLLGKAVHYTLGQWPKLIRFLEYGDIPLDNNRCENAIRPFVVGRKGWMFSDTVKGAIASANLFSLVETAKANGVEPYVVAVRAAALRAQGRRLRSAAAVEREAGARRRLISAPWAQEVGCLSAYNTDANFKRFDRQLRVVQRARPVPVRVSH
jgi:Transposase IS66 family